MLNSFKLMESKKDFFLIESRSTKNIGLSLFLVTMAISVFLIFYTHWYLAGISFIASFYFLFFFIKEISVDSDKIKFYYPFRPFFKSNYVFIDKIISFKFKPTHDGPQGWPYIKLRFSKYPYFFEFRINGMNDVFEIIRLMALKGRFKVKASTPFREKELKDFIIAQNIQTSIMF